MPQISKVFYLEVTPERFLECCSQSELIEVDLLLNSERFQQRMRGDSCHCEYEDGGCAYHACMSNDCQRPGMLKRGDCKYLGKGNCEQ